MACARCVPGRIHAARLRHASARHRPSEAAHPRLRRHGPEARRPLAARGPAAQHLEALGRRQRPAARDDALARVADGVGVVCDRRQPRQAQHLRLPRPRHHDLPSRSRHGPARAAEVPVRLHSAREAEAVLDPRRHVLLGHGRAGRRPLEHPDRAGDVPARGRRPTASCSPGCRCPTSAARWAPSTTSPPTSVATRKATPSSAASSSGWCSSRTSPAPSSSGRPTRSIRQQVQLIRAKGPTLERRRSHARRRAAGAGRRPAADDDHVASRGADGDGRNRRRSRSLLEPGRVEPLDRPRVPRQLPRPAPRHGAAAADERRFTSCSSTCRR